MKLIPLTVVAALSLNLANVHAKSEKEILCSPYPAIVLEGPGVDPDVGTLLYVSLFRTGKTVDGIISRQGSVTREGIVSHTQSMDTEIYGEKKLVGSNVIMSGEDFEIKVNIPSGRKVTTRFYADEKYVKSTFIEYRATLTINGEISQLTCNDYSNFLGVKTN